jgi:hypothetical protein
MRKRSGPRKEFRDYKKRAVASQTQKLNSDLGQMQTYTEQLQAALRDAESSTTATHNDMEPASPESYKMSLIKQRLPGELQIKLSSLEEAKQLPSSLMRKSAKQLSSLLKRKRQLSSSLLKKKAKQLPMCHNEEKRKKQLSL